MTGRADAGVHDPVLWSTWRTLILADKSQRKSDNYRCDLILGAAVALNRDDRTIRRWLEVEPTGARKRYELSEEDQAWVRVAEGNLSAAWDEMHKLGLIPVCKKTFRRAFGRLSPAVQLGLQKGARAMRARLPWVRLEPARRPNEIWEIDHTLLARIVIRDSHNNRGHPWLTVVFDVFTRMIVGFSVTLTKDIRGNASTESAFAALADAFLGHDYDGTFVGGKPGWVRFDQGSDLIHPVADALDRLGVEPLPVEAETPEHKLIERFNRTFKGRYLPFMRGFGERLESAA